MISYLYTGKYKENHELWSKGTFVYIRMYALAEKYDIPGLQSDAREGFSTLASLKWPYRNLPAIIVAIYSSTPSSDRGLRDTIIKLCAQHLPDFFALEEESVDEIRDAAPEFEHELLVVVARLGEEERLRLGSLLDSEFKCSRLHGRCPRCGSPRAPTMILERVVSSNGKTEGIGQRCVQCGEGVGVP